MWRGAQSLWQIGFNLNAQADLVANEGQTVVHAEIGAPQNTLRIGTAAAFAQRQIEAALEAADLQAHRFCRAQQDQGAFDRDGLLTVKNELLAAKQDVGEILDVEPCFAAQYVVAQLEAGIERGGIDADVDRAAACLAIKLDAAGAVVELAALGGKAKMVDFETGVSVAGVNRIVGGKGRQGESAEGKQEGFDSHGRRQKRVENGLQGQVKDQDL